MLRPAQVQRQIDRVAEIAQELGAGSQSANPEQVVDPAATQTVATPQPETVSKEEFDRLQQRYKTLQGMHAADANRAREALAERDGQISSLSARIEALEASSNKQPDFVPGKYVTEEDEQEYGEVLAPVRRAAKEEAEAAFAAQSAADRARIAHLENVIATLQSTVVPKVQDFEKDAQQRVRDNFWAQVNGAVPNWREHNQNQEFIDWLADEDTLSGYQRQQLLNDARAAYDADRVIRILKEWERVAAGTQHPSPTPQPKPRSAGSELEKLVAPSPGRGGATVVSEPKIYSRKDISAFYAEITSGKYRGREAEKARIESDIFTAQVEGRVKE